jgi:hypothetical protein
MAIKYTKIFHSKAPPKFTQIRIFWFENIPSGNPAPGGSVAPASLAHAQRLAEQVEDDGERRRAQEVRHGQDPILQNSIVPILRETHL